jgi:CBS domain-containing protein
MEQPGVGPGWLTVDAFLREYAGHPERPSAFLVEQWGGGLAGLAPTAAMEALPPRARYEARATDFAIGVQRLPVLRPDDAASQATNTMGERGAEAWALVVADDQIVGILSLADIAVTARRFKDLAAVNSSGWSLTRG